MKHRCDEMNRHIRKTKGVASNHPVPMLEDSFLLDLDKRRDGNCRPDEIQQIEAHAADFASGGMRRHITGSRHDQQDGRDINVAVDPVKLAAFLKKPS